MAIAFLALGGSFAYTYITGVATIGVGDPSADVATSNVSASQPNWGAITDNLSANTTCGEVPTGHLFTVSPDSAYSGDLMVGIYLTNTGSLIKAYQYLNMKVYLGGSAQAGETPNYQALTLQNGEVNFSLENILGVIDNWIQTTQSDFEGGTLVNLDTTTSPGDVLLDTYSDNVSDSFTDESKIASSENLTVSGGQVKLSTDAAGTETLRPNAAGNVTNISSQFPDSSAHWDKVDEATSDNWSTYISTNSTSYQRDLYNIPDHTVGTGGINSVTVHFRFAGDRQVYAIPYAGDGDPGYLKTVEINSSGNITDTVIDTLNFDTVRGKTPDIIHISDDVYAIAYTGGPADSDLGQLKTVEIDSDGFDSGNITDTVIDTLNFDILKGKTPKIINVSGDVYAIAYSGDGDLGYLKTVEINSSGNITDTVIDTLNFDILKGKTPSITNVSGDVYAIAYAGDGDDGTLKTVEITSSGNITDTAIDYLEFDNVKGATPVIIPISGDVYAIAYAGDGDPGYLKTVEILSSGNITDTVIDTLNFDTVRGKTPSIIHISGDVYAIPYTGGPADADLGQLKTVEILSSGNITDTAIDTLEFDALKGKTPRIIPISDDVYAIAYAGDGDDGTLKTVEITSSGNITDTVIDTLEFDTVKGATPDIVYVSGGRVYARAAIRTYDTVYTGSTENTTGDDFVAKSYQWTTNPNTASDWTWDEIDNLEIGIDLKTTDGIDDNVYCTQAYVEVSYTSYYARGELLSINLLSGEAVVSTDNFTYNASAIPSGTGLRAQFSTDNTTWYSSSDVSDGWDTLSSGTHAIDLSGLGWSGPNFYYTMEFTSANQTDTPVLDEIAVTFTSYYASGNLTSSNHDAGYGAYWRNSFFTINEPSGTDIKFQLRSAATEGGLSSATWYGPTGTGDYYTTSGTAINSVHDGDRWIQYKAYFAGLGGSTPKLSDTRITYASSPGSYTVEITGGGYCLISDNTSEWGAGWTATPELYAEVTQR